MILVKSGFPDESRRRGMETSVPLFPESREAGNRVFRVLLGEGGERPVEFVETQGGGVDLYVERWRLHKKGK